MWQCRSPRRSSTVTSRGTSKPFASSPAVLAQLGRDPRQAEPLVDLLLGRAAHRLAGLVVEDPVLGDVHAAADRRLAQRDVVARRAGEVLQQVAELVGLDDPQVDAQAVVRAAARGVLPGVARGLQRVDARQRGGQRGRVRRGGDDVQVLHRVGEPARGARDLDVHRRGVGAQRLGDLLADLERGRQDHALRRLVGGAGLERGEHALLELHAEALRVAQPAGLGRLAQRVDRVDAELVVHRAHALRADAGQAGDRGEAGRDAVAELPQRRDGPRVDHRLDLLLERLADARQASSRGPAS